MARQPRKWEAVFLSTLEATGVISQAAKTAGIRRQTVYDCQRADPEFAHKCLDALDAAADGVLAEAMRLAIQGKLVPVYSRGRVVRYKIRKSDTLLMFVHKTLLQQSERVLQRARTFPSAPPAAIPSPKTPVEIMVASRDGVHRPLTGRPAPKAGRAA